MEVVDATVTPENAISATNAPALFKSNLYVASHNQRPAYVLREDDGKGEALAKKLAKGVKLNTVKIVIPFTR